MGPGSLAFVGGKGTYHVDVVSLDLDRRRATVRVRWAP